MDVSTITTIVIIALTLTTIAQGFIISRQVDMVKVNELIKTLTPQVERTATQADDIALNVAKLLVDMLSKAQAPSEPLADDGGELTITKTEL